MMGPNGSKNRVAKGAELRLRVVKKFDDEIRNTGKHVCTLFQHHGSHAHDSELSVRELSKFLMDQAYTCYNNLKPGSVHD